MLVKAMIVIVSIIVLAVAPSKYTMPSDKQDNTSPYRVEYSTTGKSKLRLSEEALRELNQEACLVATVKVAQEGYIPSGVEIRTWISPIIFTANISPEVLERLQGDPLVVSIEPVYKLRSY